MQFDLIEFTKDVRYVRYVGYLGYVKNSKIVD